MFDVLARITELRKLKGWSVYKLAQLSGIPQSSIATWYQKNYYPPIDKLERLCDTFGITLSEFFSDGKGIPLSPEQKSVLDKWKLLNPMAKAAVLQVMDALIR